MLSAAHSSAPFLGLGTVHGNLGVGYGPIVASRGGLGLSE